MEHKNNFTFDSIYPMTIVKDRYSGVYSGGAYTAWNLDFDDIPMDIAGDDVTCRSFWCCKDTSLVGRGKTVEAAAEDLFKRISEYNGGSCEFAELPW